VRTYSIKLNDAGWSSADARASGLRSLLLAQLGSDGIDGVEFAQRLAELTVRELIPRLLREELPDAPDVIEAATRCEREGTSEAAQAAEDAAAAANAANAARAARAAEADSYLIQSADIAVRVLQEMDAPGCALLELEQ